MTLSTRETNPGQNSLMHNSTSHAASRSTILLGRSAGLCYSNTTVYYGIHERSECIPVDSGVTNLIHDRRSCVDFTLEVEANVA